MSTFFYLLLRDFKSLRSRVFKILIDNVALLSVNIFVFGYLLPAMGMDRSLIIPIFIGSSVWFFAEVCFTLSVGIVEDLKHDRFIDYHLGLPIRVRSLIIVQILRAVIETSIIVLPMLSFGVYFLADGLVKISTNWPAFIIIYLLTSIFFSTLFLLFGFACEYDWFWDNVWARRIEPIMLFSATIVVWKDLYNLSKFWGILFLLNPVTYAAEGLRFALIGGDRFLPFSISVLGIGAGCAINLFLLFPSVKKALDHV